MCAARQLYIKALQRGLCALQREKSAAMRHIILADMIDEQADEMEKEK